MFVAPTSAASEDWRWQDNKYMLSAEGRWQLPNTHTHTHTQLVLIMWHVEEIRAISGVSVRSTHLTLNALIGSACEASWITSSLQILYRRFGSKPLICFVLNSSLFTHLRLRGNRFYSKWSVNVNLYSVNLQKSHSFNRCIQPQLEQEPNSVLKACPELKPAVTFTSLHWWR